MTAPRFTLQPGHWYGWQMIPGYTGEPVVPYFSPIFVHNVLQAARSRVISLELTDVLYAAGAQHFQRRLHLLRRGGDYLVAGVANDRGGTTDRVSVISQIGYEWIRRFCPSVWQSRPPESLGPTGTESASEYLSTVFGIR